MNFLSIETGACGQTVLPTHFAPKVPENDATGSGRASLRYRSSAATPQDRGISSSFGLAVGRHWDWLAERESAELYVPYRSVMSIHDPDTAVNAALSLTNRPLLVLDVRLNPPYKVGPAVGPE